jgi:hypothetical protein
MKNVGLFFVDNIVVRNKIKQQKSSLSMSERTNKRKQTMHFFLLLFFPTLLLSSHLPSDCSVDTWDAGIEIGLDFVAPSRPVPG